MTSSPALARKASDPRASRQSTELSDQVPVSSNTSNKSTTTSTLEVKNLVKMLLDNTSPDPESWKLRMSIWFINSCSKKLLGDSNKPRYSAFFAHQQTYRRFHQLWQDTIERYPAFADAFRQKFSELREADSVERTRNWFKPVRYVSMGAKQWLLYPETTGGWDQVDPLMPSSAEDEGQRYTAVWRWEPKTCAVDAIICLAVQLNANRIQADQSPAFDTSTLGAHWLHTIARLPWGRMSQNQRSKLRNALNRSVAEASTTYKDIGQDRPLDEVYRFVFKDLPQVNSLLVKRWKCACESSTWAYSNLTRITSFQARALAMQGKADPRTISDLLQSAFNPIRDTMATANCCPRHACEEFDKQYVVVGRLAPTLCLSVASDNLGPVLWDDHTLIDITFKHWNPDADNTDDTGACGLAGPVDRKAQYRLEAVIYHETLPDGSGHYCVESRLQSEKTNGRRHMDMFRRTVTKSQCVSEGSWEMPNAQPALLVFRAVSGDGTSGI